MFVNTAVSAAELCVLFLSKLADFSALNSQREYYFCLCFLIS